jgi:hypothetical protein
MSNGTMQLCPKTGLPMGEPLLPLEFPHFPTRWQAVVWRNWGLVTSSRLARILLTAESNVTEMAQELGLGEAASQETERLWLLRGYITLIRQNWHLLPYEQLLELLGWSPGQMAYALKEDDFLWGKLGGMKPDAAPVFWAPLTAPQAQATKALKDYMASGCLGTDNPGLVRPFDFFKQFGELQVAKVSKSRSSFGLRMAYSYSAVYGDPLLEPELDPFPEGLLKDLAGNGINAVWLQGVLYTMIPWFGESEFSLGHEKRVAGLNALVAKAARHGIGVYLYLNEPRAMPMDFFKGREDWKGAQRAQELACLCLSQPEVLTSFKNGVGELFRKVPGLTGVFTISRSENSTHCHSHSNHLSPCPRCSQKSPADLIALVNNVIAEGIHAVKPDADVIVWNWPWDEDWAPQAIEQLHPDVRFMCTSESYLPTEAMGVKGLVADYSMSKVGPGPLAVAQWRKAADCGLPILAKVQLNNTWECSAVPYLPVPFLVKQHLRNLQERRIRGLMISWTLGGYPGGNLRLIDKEPEELAVELFGEGAAPGIISAWRMFSGAFSEFPLHGCSCLYTGPQNYGPMNLLFTEPSGRKATMLGFPYDDLDAWRGNHFPGTVFEEQFRKVSEGWCDGLETLKKTVPLVPTDRKAHIDDLLNVAEAAYCHFRSTYLQIRFIRLRDTSDKADFIHDRNSILDEEISLAKKLLAIVRSDSRIGFEASNHYYYTVNDLKEKILNCENIRQKYLFTGMSA